FPLLQIIPKAFGIELTTLPIIIGMLQSTELLRSVYYVKSFFYIVFPLLQIIPKAFGIELTTLPIIIGMLQSTELLRNLYVKDPLRFNRRQK
ncbi:MAG: hypothetical protein ACQER7_15415, partial [Bacteroidota bacterium]